MSSSYLCVIVACGLLGVMVSEKEEVAAVYLDIADSAVAAVVPPVSVESC